MKTKSVLFILLTFLILLTSCEEKEKVWTELPPATETGANTIGCMVDGQLWATEKLPGYTLRPRMMATYTVYKTDSVVLEYYAESKDKSGIGFTVINPKAGANDIYYLGCSFSSISFCDGLTALNISGLDITKLDIENHILSGTFNFQVHCSNDSSKKANLTDGRFDVFMDVMDWTNK